MPGKIGRRRRARRSATTSAIALAGATRPTQTPSMLATSPMAQTCRPTCSRSGRSRRRRAGRARGRRPGPARRGAVMPMEKTTMSAPGAVPSASVTPSTLPCVDGEDLGRGGRRGRSAMPCAAMMRPSAWPAPSSSWADISHGPHGRCATERPRLRQPPAASRPSSPPPITTARGTPRRALQPRDLGRAASRRRRWCGRRAAGGIACRGSAAQGEEPVASTSSSYSIVVPDVQPHRVGRGVDGDDPLPGPEGNGVPEGPSPRVRSTSPANMVDSATRS